MWSEAITNYVMNRLKRNKRPSRFFCELSLSVRVNDTFGHSASKKAIKSKRNAKESDLSTYRWEIRDRYIKMIGKRCFQLQKIDMQDCNKITDTEIEWIANNCCELQVLCISGCDKITEAGIESIGKKCPKIKELHCDYFHLQELKIRGRENITNTGIAAITNIFCQLQEIDIRRCDKITDVGIDAIANKCSQLQSLNMQHCKKITDAGIESVANKCTQLQKIHIYGCNKITDIGIEAIGNNCSQLQELGMSTCDKITVTGIESIGKNCPQLKELYCSGCNLASLPEHVVGYFKDLQILDLRNNIITRLPRSIAQINPICKCTFDGNPLQVPPLSIAEQGPKSIGRYFDEIDKGCTSDTKLEVGQMGLSLIAGGF